MTNKEKFNKAVLILNDMRSKTSGLSNTEREAIDSVLEFLDLDGENKDKLNKIGEFELFAYNKACCGCPNFELNSRYTDDSYYCNNQEFCQQIESRIKEN